MAEIEGILAKNHLGTCEYWSKEAKEEVVSSSSAWLGYPSKFLGLKANHHFPGRRVKSSTYICGGQSPEIDWELDMA